MNSFETTTIIIAVAGFFVSVFALWFSHKSAVTAENSLQYVKSPLLIIEKKTLYYHLKNIGKGIAKNITWETSKHFSITTNSEFFDYLLPDSQLLGSSQMTPDGIEIPLVFKNDGMKPNEKYFLILRYEDIEGKGYESRFETRLHSDGTIKHKLLSHKRIKTEGV